MDDFFKIAIGAISTFLIGLGAYFLKNYLPARQKESQVSSASARERDVSRQVFGETQAATAQNRQNDREDKYLANLIASADGISEATLDAIKNSRVELVALIVKVDAQGSERDRLIIASQNQVIGQNAKILTVLVQLLKEAGIDVTETLLATLGSATIDSPSVQTAQKVATDAVEHSVDDAPKVIAIVEAKETPK